MKHFKTNVILNESVSASWNRIDIVWDDSTKQPVPGQFFTVRSSDACTPLLRRPFAFSAYTPAANGAPARASAVYKIRGEATRQLAGLKAGSTLDVIGPLGKPFPDPLPGETAILAAGGIGLGPVMFLAQYLTSRNISTRLVVGFPDDSRVPDMPFPEDSVICTDNGSKGFHGRPTDWISRNAVNEGTRIYACGPAGMLSALAALAAERDWTASLSAEQWMACGIGACMGCVLPARGDAGYLRACADGPVFERDDIDWEAVATR